MTKNSNSERFITAYNNIDYSLRTIYNFKRSMTYTDVIRRSVMLNSIVRKYEEDLIDFGRLRNAIIHQGNSRYTIAEPHDDIVKKIELLAAIISEPPKAIDKVGNAEVMTISPEMKIGEAIELIYRTGYSNLPVYENGSLIGILNGRKLINVIGEKISNKENVQDVINTMTAKDALSDMGDDYYYIIADENISINEAMTYFENNRKLVIILITKTGKETEKPLKIITAFDVIDMKKILDVY